MSTAHAAVPTEIAPTPSTSSGCRAGSSAVGTFPTLPRTLSDVDPRTRRLVTLGVLVGLVVVVVVATVVNALRG